MSHSTRVFGLLNFPCTLYCSPELLGQSIPIRMGGYSGTLEMPFLPSWEAHQKDLLHKALRAPADASTWKYGDQPIYWGSTIPYSKGVSNVELGLLSFDLPTDKIEEESQKIYQSSWVNLFSDYHEILVERGKKNVRIKNPPNHGLDLYCFDSSGNGRIPYSHTPIVEIILSSDGPLKLDGFSKLCELASSGAPPNLQYRMLIDSYRALSREDYRKAIIEAASALEIALTERITLEFDVLGIRFGDKLLKKYRQLGGRFELAELLDLPLPNDYKKILVDLRNVVVHQAKFPEFEATQRFVYEAALLLSTLTPDMSETIA